jgi:pteridine reductase
MNGAGMTEKRLSGKTALVTGAARRIGRAIALALADEGVNIVVHDRRSVEQHATELCDRLRERGTTYWPVVADFDKAEDYETLISRTIETAGSLDIVINSASLFLPGALPEVGFNDLTRHIQVNAWAPFVLSREFARLVNRGKIVNLLDTKILGYDRAHVAYILSKHMLSMLTKMCALEFAPRITVNAVAPGLILPPKGKGEDYLDQLSRTVPLQRHGEPEDIAKAVLYLLTSDFVTGQVIYVDGGRHLQEEDRGPNPDQ